MLPRAIRALAAVAPGARASIAVEGDQAPGRVRMRRIVNGRRATLTDFVLDQAVRGSEVRTDGWTG